MIKNLKPILLFVLALGAGNAWAQESGTVIVANMSDNTVMLLDAATRDLVTTIESGPAPHEVTVSPSGEWAIITNYGNREEMGHSLSLINIPEAKLTNRFDLGMYERPHGAFFLPGDTLVAITSEVMAALVFVDIRTGEVVDTLSTTQRASHMLAATPSGETMFTTNIVDGTITEFDGRTRTRGRVLEVAPMVEGIALSPDGSRAWIGSNAERSVHVFNIETGQTEAKFDGFGFPYRMAVMSNGKYALLSDPGNSEVRVIDAQTLKHVKTIVIPSDGALPTAEIPGSAAPEGLVISPDSKYAYVSLQGLNQVLVIDLEKLEDVGRLSTGGWPDGIGFSPLSAVNH